MSFTEGRRRVQLQLHILGTALVKIFSTPYGMRDIIGDAAHYFIHAGYEIRTDALEFDDTPFRDEFQLCVYQYARQVADAHEFKLIADVGCGSGYKLVTEFYDCDTMGLDLTPAIEFCRKKWAGRQWEVIDFNKLPLFMPKLIICSDVIEHLKEPNQLMEYLHRWRPHRVILSTPARDDLGLGTYNGPPKNLHHVREWGIKEFHVYMREWGTVRQHFVVNATQIVELEFAQ